MRPFAVYFIFIALLTVSCSKEHDTIRIDEDPFSPRTNIEVGSLVISTHIEGSFYCIINDEIYTNERPGIILIEDLLLEREGNLILIKAEGYFDETRYVIPALGAHVYLEVQMSELNNLSNFNAGEGGKIELNRMEIDIAPNSIVDKDGNIYTGDVSVSMKNTFNSAYASTIRLFPQNLVVEEDKISMLHFLDGNDIQLRDNNLNPLFTKVDFSATIKMKIQSEPNITVPDIVEMRRFDEVKGTWDDIGTAERDGDWWHGTINKLGMINFGIVRECRVAQIKLRTGDGHVVPNKFVYTQSGMTTPFSLAYSDSEGIIRIHVPVDEEFVLGTFEKNGSEVLRYEKIDPVLAGEGEIILDDFILTSELYQVYEGNIVDCDGENIKKSALAMDGVVDIFSPSDYISYVFSNDDGYFNFAQLKNSNGSLEVEVLDLNSNFISNQYSLPIDGENNVDFTGFPACDLYEAYLIYTIDGQAFPFVYNCEFTTTFLDPKYEFVLSADAMMGADENNRTSILFEHTSDFGVKPSYDIKNLEIRYNKGLKSYAFECAGDCEHTLEISNVTVDHYEGFIRENNGSDSEIIGAFKFPR